MGKGGDFERVVSKALSKWLTGSEKPYQYWRMPGSGGLATIHEECVDLSGDIRSLTRAGDFLTRAFSLECKNGYPKTSFWQTFKDLKNFELKNFWVQCLYDACKADKRPILIYRKKGRNVIIGLEKQDIEQFISIKPELNDLPAVSVFFDKSLPTVVFFDFYEFLNIVTPDVVKKFIKIRGSNEQDQCHIEHIS